MAKDIGTQNKPLGLGKIRYCEKEKLGESIYPVYKGEVKQNGKNWIQCAVKKLKITKKDRVTINNEVEILKKLKHKHIVEYYYSEIINIDRSIYMHICMELFDVTMKEYIEQKKRKKKGWKIKIDDRFIKWLQSRNIFIILKQVVSGLEYLHEDNENKKRIVHFDLKPANILLKITNEPFSGTQFIRAAIADFGLSKSIIKEESGLSMSIPRGSDRWMSPEVININNGYGTNNANGTNNGKIKYVHPSSDVYILGLVFYYFLTDGDNAEGFRIESNPYWHDDLPKLYINNRTDFFYDVILKMLLEEPKNRPTAAQLNRNTLLNQYINDETVEIKQEEIVGQEAEVTNSSDNESDTDKNFEPEEKDDKTMMGGVDIEELQMKYSKLEEKFEKLHQELEKMKLQQELDKMKQGKNKLETDLRSEAEDLTNKSEDVKIVKKMDFNDNTELFPKQKVDNQKVEQVHQAYNIVSNISDTSLGDKTLGDNDPSIIPGAQNYVTNFKRNNIKKAYELAGMALLYNSSYFISHLQTMDIREEDAKTIYHSLIQRCKAAGLWDIQKIYGIGPKYAQGLKSSFNDTQKYRNSYQYFNSMAVGKYLENAKNHYLMYNFLGQFVDKNSWGDRIINDISSQVSKL